LQPTGELEEGVASRVGKRKVGGGSVVAGVSVVVAVKVAQPRTQRNRSNPQIKVRSVFNCLAWYVLRG
jgi:hypothetical protein